MTALIAIVALILVGLNAVATVYVIRSYSFTGPQKAWQIAVVWLIPLFGGILILSMLKFLGSDTQRADLTSYEDRWVLPGEGPESDHTQLDSGGHGHS